MWSSAAARALVMQDFPEGRSSVLLEVSTRPAYAHLHVLTYSCVGNDTCCLVALTMTPPSFRDARKWGGKSAHWIHSLKASVVSAQ